MLSLSFFSLSIILFLNFCMNNAYLYSRYYKRRYLNDIVLYEKTTISSEPIPITQSSTATISSFATANTTSASNYSTSTSLLTTLEPLVLEDSIEQSIQPIGRRRERVKTTPDRRWEIKPIGVVESPYYEKFGVPKQATIMKNNTLAQGKLIIYPGYEECISDLDGFDYIWVITLMHLNSGFKTKIRPQPREDSAQKPPSEVGLFSSRSPHRPNPIALSALQVVEVNVAKGYIIVNGLDLLTDTPILDIKPYIPAFDSFPEARAGWMDVINSNSTESRLTGYQSIYSPRGARATRRYAIMEQKQQEQEKQQQQQEQKE